MAKFINPYNFVRSQYQCDKTAAPNTHEKIYPALYSGQLYCTLTTVSKVALKERSIYGSSLKGMIRAVAEAISQACYTIGKRPQCERADRLCICCRMFGWLQQGNVHLGRVSISDVQEAIRANPAYIEEHALSPPKPERHPIFYPGNGRKFYYHHNPDLSPKKVNIRGAQDQKIFIIEPGQHFSLKVDFTELTEPEFGLLLYALRLEDNWYHKFGYGKPLGFGTVKIAIESIKLRPENYYENWDARFSLVESESLVGFIKERVEEFFQHQFNRPYQDAEKLGHWRDLRHLLSRHDHYNIHYPSQQWFETHSNQRLPTPTEIEAGPHNWLPE